jgi:alpha-beta hydrolase superfamily lysophospholipase
MDPAIEEIRNSLVRCATMSSMSTRVTSSPAPSSPQEVKPQATPEPELPGPAAPESPPTPQGDGIDPVAAPTSSNAPAYRVAIQKYMTNEQQIIASQGFTQKPTNRSFALFHNGPPSKGLAVMLHGFSAGTVQWNPIAEELYAQGYDVFVPALPGHGLVDKDGNDDTSRVPTAATWKRWDEFEDAMFELTRSSGKLSVVGISCGGMLALKMAERHGKERGPDGKPILRNVVAASPFLKLIGNYATVGPVDIKNSTASAALRKVEHAVGKPADWFLQTQQVDMDKDGPRPIPYGFRYSNQDEILGMDNAAKETRKNAKHVQGVPTQIIATAADDQADPAAMQQFARESGAAFFEFPADEHVPHAMVNPLENPNPQAWDKVRDIILSRLQ